MTGSATWIVGYGIGAVLAVVLSLAGVALLYITFLSFTRDLWAIGFVYAQRTNPTRWIGVIVLVLLLVLGIWFFGARTQAALFPLVAVGPWLTVNMVSNFAWWRDNNEIKQGALEMRSAEAQRVGDPAPTLQRRTPWADYIFDVARVQQRALYEPPPI